MPPRTAAEREKDDLFTGRCDSLADYKTIPLKQRTDILLDEDIDDELSFYGAQQRKKRRRINGALPRGRFFARVAHKTYPSYWRAGIDVDPSGTSFAETNHVLRGVPPCQTAPTARWRSEDPAPRPRRCPTRPKRPRAWALTVCDALSGMAFDEHLLLHRPSKTSPQPRPQPLHLQRARRLHTQIKRAVSADPRYFRRLVPLQSRGLPDGVENKGEVRVVADSPP